MILVQARQIERQVEDRLGARGIRSTRGRRAVVGALQRAPGPQSAAELYRRLRGAVPMSSLYRTLAVLEDAGVLTPHHGARGITRYELAEWLTGHHHHLVCSDCGTVEDVPLAEGPEMALAGVVDEVSAAARFTATGHTLEIEGTCSRCES